MVSDVSDVSYSALLRAEMTFRLLVLMTCAQLIIWLIC